LWSQNVVRLCTAKNLRLSFPSEQISSMARKTTNPDERQEEGVDRRTGEDRRKGPTKPLSWASLRGRRRNIRRNEDLNVHFYIDRYGWPVVAVVVTTMTLCTLDALLTLRLCRVGVKDLNPVMRYFIELGPTRFAMTKYFMTAGSVLFLTVHKNYRLLKSTVPAKYLLFAVPVLYGLLILYELALIFS
jgi:hypothetical protein